MGLIGLLVLTGGVVFGPTGAENYTRKLNVTAKRRALTQALSLANSSKNLVVIEDFVVKDGKTKTAAALLAKIGTPSRVVIVVTTKTPELVRATANLPEVIVSTANGLNVYDVLNASHIVITKDAIAAIEARLTGGTK